MEDALKTILFGFIFMLLAGVLILTTVNDFGATYNQDVSQVTGGSLSLAKFNNITTSFETNSRNLMETFRGGSVWSMIAGVVVDGFFGITKSIFDLILSPFDIMQDIMVNVFGIPVLVSSIIIGALIITIIFGIWSLIKIGN